MPMPEYEGSTNIIAGLGTTPQERGLTTDQFKAKFDQFGTEFTTWFNATFKAYLDANGIAKNKLDATAAPTVNDDSEDGYSINSIWIDTTNDKAYICVDASMGAAVWIEITVVGSTGDTTGMFEFIDYFFASSVTYVDIPIPTTHQHFKILFTHLRVVTAGAVLQMQVSLDGTTFVNTGYKWDLTTVTSGATSAVVASSDSDTKAVLSLGLTANGEYRGSWDIDFRNTDGRIPMRGRTSHYDNNLKLVDGTFSLGVTAGLGTIKIVRFLLSTGNFHSVSVNLLGSKNV